MPIIESTEIINGEEVKILIADCTLASVSSKAVRGSTAIDVIEKAQGAFRSGVELVKQCATQVVEGVHNLDDTLKPEELQIQLAIKLGASAGAFLTNLNSEAQMQVTLKWRLKQ